MTLRIANRVFAPRPWAIAATVALMFVFITLGSWQLGRGRDKQAMVDSFEQGATSNVILADETVDELPRYQHVATSGHYESARQILLDNMPSATGRPGYRVLTPFVREGSTRILMVDRGWVPLGPTRAELPPVTVSNSTRIVAGRLDQLPAPGIRVGSAGTPGDTTWPRVLNFPQQADLEQVLGASVESRILLLDPVLPDGYERVWRPALGFGPERHLGYAIQWFAFALALLAIFIALSLESVVPADEVGNPS
jgi:surfeit locus 1 family protein